MNWRAYTVVTSVRRDNIIVCLPGGFNVHLNVAQHFLIKNKFEKNSENQVALNCFGI